MLNFPYRHFPVESFIVAITISRRSLSITSHITMLASAGISCILGEDGYSQWRAMGPDWARFVSFWSKPNSHNGFQHEYPYALELQLSDNIKDQSSSLASVSTSILVTQSHADLYERIKTGLELDIIEDTGMRPPPLRNGVIITGQPGTDMLPSCHLTVAHYWTGKSVCLWYKYCNSPPSGLSS